MRTNTIFLIGILLYLSNSVTAQTNQYHPFEENVTWRYDLHTDVPYPSFHCIGDYYYHYYLDGDTLIDNLTYKKLYRSYVHYPSSGDPSCFPYYLFEEGYAGGIREDVSNNQVYFRDTYYPAYDTLLFDYNLSVGDTLETFLEWCLPVIDSIDSVLIDGSYRKRWHYTTCTYGGVPSYFIQGYGGTNGLVEWITGLQRAKLICIKKNDQTIYETGVFSPMSCNDIYADIEKLDHSNWRIHPIPANSELTIEGISTIDISTIEVVNQFGQRLDVSILKTKETFVLDVSNLENGLYFVRFNANNEWVSKRFSVQN